MAKTLSRPRARHDGLAKNDRAIPPERLRWVCDASRLPFETTEQVPPLTQTMGQERGVASLAFGLEAERPASTSS
jgi:hypothetical protein